MKIFIPEIGTTLRLSAPWKFTLYAESRNKDMVKYFAPDRVDDIRYWEAPLIGKYELPEATELKVDRIYIRKGNTTYSSVSFWASIPKVKQRLRFWAKLSEVNNIEFELP